MSLSPQTVALITAIGGFVVPPVVSLLKQQSWSAQVKQLIAMACSGAVAAVAIALTAPHDFGLGFVTLAGLVFAGSQLAYAFFKGSSFESALARFGSKASKAAPKA